MKIFNITKKRLMIFICLILCTCGIMIVSAGKVIPTNTTPATNKTVILDAGHRYSGGWYLLNLLFKNVDFASV